MAIDILRAFIHKPPELDFVVPGMIAGTVGSIISPGGAGKTMFLMQLCTFLAGGTDTLKMGDGLKNGKIAYIAAEDPEPALLHRVHSIGNIIRHSLWEEVAKNLSIEALTGYSPNLDDERWMRLIIGVATGQRLLVLDTLRRFHQNDENDAGAMSRLLAQLEYVAMETGCSIIFAHHTSKSAAVNGRGDTQQAARGSSVLTDNVRFQSFLSGMSESESREYRDPFTGSDFIGMDRNSYVRFGVSKSNYGPPINDRWFRRGEGGVLEPVDLLPARERTEKPKGKERNEM